MQLQDRGVSRFTVLLSIVAAAAASLRAQQAEPAVPVFKDGEAQIVDAFKHPADWIRHDLWVETTFDSDGDGKPDRMHVDVTRQKQTDSEGLKVAVVYETSPYFAGIGSTDPKFNWDPHQELGAPSPARTPMPSIQAPDHGHVISNDEVKTWVPRGFAVVHSESPGTGKSQGCPSVGGDNEALAPKAVIDWLNGRAPGYTTIDGTERVEAYWCTGKVGMTGTSYNGTLPIAVATTGVEGLEAIIPISPNTSYYAYYRSNGLVRHPGGYMGEDVDVLYDFINSGNPDRRDWCNKHVREEVLNANQDRVTGDFSPFWEGRDYVLHMKKWKAATLIVHGFNDWNVMPQHSVRVYAELKRMGVPCIAYFHQGGHGGPPPLSMCNRWFSRFLYGQANGIENGPHAWIVREDERAPTAYDDYPVPGSAPVTLHPRAGGGKVGGLALEPKPGQKTETLIDDASITGAEMAAAEASPHRLLYATPELSEAVHLSGTARLKIRLACSKPAANLSVWLVSLPWTGRGERNRRVPITDNLITRGWADPQNHESLSESKPLVPGQFYELAFDLEPDDQVIPAGARIGLMIFSSDHDFTLWPAPGTELKVDLDATSLQLPVVGGAAAFGKAIAAGR